MAIFQYPKQDLPDSGRRQQFPTGSQRDDDTGKGYPSLIPTVFIKRLAVHFQLGAQKYDRDNWMKGQPLSRYIDSGWRHMMAARDGDDGEDHAAAWAWNCCAFIWTKDAIERGKLPAELDDLGICDIHGGG